MGYTVKEIVNDILHVIAGFTIAYLLIPTAEWWTVLLTVLAFSAVREHIQHLRGHHQKHFHMYTDNIGFLFGGVVFIAVRRFLPHTNRKKMK